MIDVKILTLKKNNVINLLALIQVSEHKIKTLGRQELREGEINMKKLMYLALSFALVFSLAACGDDVKKAAEEGAAEAKETVEEGAEDAKDAVEEGAEDVKDAVEEGTEDAKDAVEEGAEDVKDAVEEGAEDVKDAVEEGADKAKDAMEEASDEETTEQGADEQ